MKYVDEYRDKETAQQYLGALARLVSRDWSIMEVCGGQTHTIIKYGIDQLIPEQISIIHGPGCPVCVTPIEQLDKAIAIGQKENVIFCSFGDMIRVPGSKTDLLSIKASGADVRIVYSPSDAIQIAQKNPDKEVVFFAIGFETTAAVNAMAVYQAKKLNLKNFSVLVSQVMVPPAIETIMSSPQNRVQGFLAAGHVCTVMGYHEYEPLAQKYQIPIVVTGFEPLDILQGIYMLVDMLENGRVGVENQYKRSVVREGNIPAQKIIQQVFEVRDRQWRGLGTLPQSGLYLRDDFCEFEAEERFWVQQIQAKEPEKCRSGEVLQGIIKPDECPAFAVECTPDNPLGAPMVSGEGACAAYYKYRSVQ